MIRVRAWMAAGLIVASGGPAAVAPRDADDPAPVVVDVVVLDAAGQVVTGLTAADFDVFSDRRRRPIVSVSSDPLPLSVVWLVDVSASARRAWKTGAREVVATLAGAMRSGDRARAGVIAGTPGFGEWSADPAGVVRTVAPLLEPDREQRYGPSPIWDAANAAIDLAAGEPGRRAVVLLTDGRATGNVHGVDHVRRRAAALNVSVHVIASWPDGLSGYNAATMFLGQLAATSGGRSVAYSETAGRPALPLAAVAARLMSELRGAHRLAFVPERSGSSTAALLVQVRCAGLTVRAPELHGRTP